MRVIRVRRFLFASTMIVLCNLFMGLALIGNWISFCLFGNGLISSNSYQDASIAFAVIDFVFLFLIAGCFQYGRKESKYFKAGFFTTNIALLFRVLFKALSLCGIENAFSLQIFIEVVDSFSLIFYLVSLLLSIEAYQEIFAMRNEKKMLKEGRYSEYVLIGSVTFSIIVDFYSTFYRNSSTSLVLFNIFSTVIILSFAVGAVSYFFFHFHGARKIERRYIHDSKD